MVTGGNFRSIKDESGEDDLAVMFIHLVRKTYICIHTHNFPAGKHLM